MNQGSEVKTKKPKTDMKVLYVIVVYLCDTHPCYYVGYSTDGYPVVDADFFKACSWVYREHADTVLANLEHNDGMRVEEHAIMPDESDD